MKVLVTGSTGQLGKEVVTELQNRGYNVLAPTHQKLDLKWDLAVYEYFEKEKPDAVIHCAAYTNVDKAEEDQVQAFEVNARVTHNLVTASGLIGKPKFLYVSTDYVYEGIGSAALKTTDTTKPINVYGQSKLDGENIIKDFLINYFIVRISWLFGEGNNFVNTMLSLKDKEQINVVNDQIGRPTYTKDLSRLLVNMIETDKYGIYNVSNEGEFVSWADFAKEIFNQKGITTKVNPVSSADYPTKAERPKNSRLDTSKLTENGFKLLPEWKDALKRFLNDKRL